MKNWKLYVILDRELAGDRNLKSLTEEIIGGGADVIQLRDKISTTRVFAKEARLVREITKHSGIQFIVNDRPDIAKAVYADGVHLGQDDLDVGSARAVLGRYGLVGVSCHSIGDALAAKKSGADYIGLGPIFKTATKPALGPLGTGIISDVIKNVDIPVVCIGGINIDNIENILDCGAEIVAAASAIIKSNDPCLATQEILKFLRVTVMKPDFCNKE